MTKSIYTMTNRKALNRDFKALIGDTVQTMYGDDMNIRKELEHRHNVCKQENIKLKLANPTLKEIDFTLPSADFSKFVKERDDKNQAWQYRRQFNREILLYNLLENDKRIAWLVRDALEAVLKAILLTGKASATLSQVVHNMKLSADHLMIGTKRIEADHWKVDELRLQLLNELAELNFVDFRVSHKTHMISIPAEHNNKVDGDTGKLLKTLAMLVQRKTILLEPAPVDRDMISQSSWWYKTPTLSADQTAFIELMHTTKWEFVPDALERIEDAFIEHSKDDEGNLPSTWDTYGPARIEEFKAQIKASFENGGHYIPGKFDSALRWYWQAEIGHTQTSEALRNLVRPAGMTDITKYDMTNSVVQMYSVGLMSKSLAKYCNLTDPSEKVGDLRSIIAEKMNETLGIQSFTKDNTKPLFMVWAYNAGKARILEGVYTDTTDFFTQQVTRENKVDGLRKITEDKFDDERLWGTWNSILHTLVPEIVELKRVVNDIIKGNGLLEASWELPDGAIAQYASVETIQKALHWVSSTNSQHQHTHHRKQLVIDAKAAGLLPRMIHSIDAYFMRQIVLRASKLGITVIPNHDSFMFDSRHTDTMFTLARELFVEIMEGHVLGNIVKQYNKTNVSVNGDFGDRDLLTVEDIQHSVPMELE